MKRLLDAPGCIAAAEWGDSIELPKRPSFILSKCGAISAQSSWIALSDSRMTFLWLIPMTIIHAIGPWNEDLSLADDTEYFTRALLASERVLFCAGARCHYRAGIPGSLSGSRTPQHFASQFKVLDLCEGYVRAVEDSERMRCSFAINWQQMAHFAYPYDKATAMLALERAKALHPVRTRPGGGLRFRALSRIIGWKAARILQVRSGRP